jgi:hypothetical protein
VACPAFMQVVTQVYGTNVCGICTVLSVWGVNSDVWCNAPVTMESIDIAVDSRAHS